MSIIFIAILTNLCIIIFMSINLYPPQAKFIEEIRHAMNVDKYVLGVAPTGFGKTIVCAWLAKRVMEKGKTLYFTVHRRDLITQTAKTFRKFNIDFGIIAAGYPSNTKPPIQLCSISTLRNRLKYYKTPDLLVIDEAHFSCAQGWSDVVDYYKEAGAYLLGLTATAWRLNGQGLDKHFNKMVTGPSVKWLIDNKFLSTYKMYAPSKPNLEGVHTRQGDYVNSEISKIMDTKTITGDVIIHWRKYAPGKRTLCFCTCVEHSQHTTEIFNANGIPAAHLDGETPMDERMRIIKAFAAGYIKIISNCQIFCEGFDLSSQIDQDITVEAVILLRPTKSLSLYLQQVGRGLRFKSYPAILLDHSGNCHHHGLPDEPRNWTLKGRSKFKKPFSIGIRTCPKCFAALPSASNSCHCGHVFPINGRMLDHVDGDLVEVLEGNAAMFKADLRNEIAKAKTYADFLSLAKKLGYKPGWAYIQHKNRLLKHNVEEDSENNCIKVGINNP